MTSRFSDYAANKLLDHLFGATAYSAAANVFGSLHTASLADSGSGAEASGNGYTRKSIANNATNFPAAASLAKTLHTLQEFAQLSGALGPIVSWGLWDASSSGNLLVHADCTSISYAANDLPKFLIDALSFGMGGAISTYAGNKLLDLLLSGAAYTPPANVYLAAFVGGSEVTGNSYARLAIANDTTQWNNAAARAKTNKVDWTMATPTGSGWGTVDEFRFYDASTGGNLLWTVTPGLAKTVPAGQAVRFVAGSLSVSLT